MTHNFPYKTPITHDSKRLIAAGQDYFTLNYKPREMIIDRGEGAKIWDLDGNDYIDLSSGIAVNSLGHQDPDLLQALDEQSRKIWHTSNVFFTAPAIELAEAMVKAVPFCERVYFSNSGAEANEAAIKLTRKWAADNGRSPQQREIITFTGSFHGRTLATVTATAQPKYQQGFEPLPGGFKYSEGFNDLAVVEQDISENTCAIMVEPVQGEGGVLPMKEGFLKGLRALCDKHNLLLILDEIQTGVGRTGKLYAYMHNEGVEPDILTSAKALGCGVPVGAMLVGSKAAEVFQFGSHGSTFGGNPLMCAVALAAFNKINDDALLENVVSIGEKLKESLHAINKKHGLFTEVRGQGLMIGAELVDAWHGKAGDIAEAARSYGVLILVAGPNVLRFVPPLNVSQEELDEGLSRLQQALNSLK